ncbi:protein FAM118B isoform X1 [Huso huso]|uniref:Protein FAM118B isoform X1 n=1 Tax=Huso huso TaxID=61971 RepID=A0ABR0YXK0_HUSHU
MSEKRKLSSCSIGFKAQVILDILKNKITVSAAAGKFAVPRTTVISWLNQKEKIIAAVSEASFSVSRKRMRTSSQCEVEDCLLKWMRNARAKNMPISGPILLARADEFARDLGIEDFKCCEAWIDRFKSRHGISTKGMSGKANAAPLDAIKQWKATTLVTLLQEYSPCDIYNADETGLFWKLLPHKTLAFKGEKCKNGKQGKNRLTVLLTANMDGSDKRKPLVIGKPLNPPCLKGVKHLPVKYTANKKAWMVSSLFEEFVRDFDRDMTSQKRKVVLVLDSCPAHPAEIAGLQSVCLQMLPLNTTAHTQPMDAGIIKNFKMHYRQLIVSRLLNAIDNNVAFNPDMLMALNLIKQAWSLVSAQTIANCFKDCGFVVGGIGGPEADVTICNESEEAAFSDAIDRLCEAGILPSDCTVDDYIAVDGFLAISEETTDKDIVTSVISKRSGEETLNDLNTDEDEDEANSVPELPKPPIKLDNAIAALDTVQMFLAQEGIEDNPKSLSTLSAELSKRVFLHAKQSTMLDFCVKL